MTAAAARKRADATAALRQRKQRRRHREGLIHLRVDITENFAEALIEAGRLTAEETSRRTLLERELERLVEDFVERWPRAST
jgi:hypothetical protein